MGLSLSLGVGMVGGAQKWMNDEMKFMVYQDEDVQKYHEGSVVEYLVQ